MSGFPIFLDLAGKTVLVVGDGPVAREKAERARAAGADVRQVAPELNHAFRDEDLDGVWLAIAAAPPEVNRAVRAAADARRVFVIAVDDVASCSAYGAARLDRGGMTIAISSDGHAPALVALLRQAIDALLPDEIGEWREVAERARAEHKSAAIPMQARRPLLLRALEEIYEGDSKGGSPWSPPLPHARGAKRRARRGELEGQSPLEQKGRVILVGAGPGAADLLTLRAVRALGEADLVLYDALVSREVLDLAPRAHRFFVGKRAGRPSAKQSTIHALMIRAARAGRTVVRLKGGDPFVLGRGGEEVLALEEAGVDVEVVPGVTSAIAGPADAGIPVTHRGLAPGFLVLSAVPSEHYRRVLATLEPGSVTVVLMMSLAARAEIAAFLLEKSWPRDLAVSIVVDATLPSAWSWCGTLGELATAPIPEDDGGRGLIVLGPVVSLADQNRTKEAEPWPMHRAR